MNLAGNAVKYNRRGGKVILYFNEISSDDKTAFFEFVCSDTGLGMSEDFRNMHLNPMPGKEKKQRMDIVVPDLDFLL